MWPSVATPHGVLCFIPVKGSGTTWTCSGPNPTILNNSSKMPDLFLPALNLFREKYKCVSVRSKYYGVGTVIVRVLVRSKCMGVSTVKMSKCYGTVK